MDVFRKGRRSAWLVLLGLLMAGSLHAREIAIRSITASVEPASAPPATQKWCGYSGGVTRVAKASTKSAIWVV